MTEIDICLNCGNPIEGCTCDNPSAFRYEPVNVECRLCPNTSLVLLEPGSVLWKGDWTCPKCADRMDKQQQEVAEGLVHG